MKRILNCFSFADSYYLQEERFQKVEINFISLSRLTPRKTNRCNTAENSLHNDGVQWKMSNFKFPFLGKTKCKVKP